MVDRRTISIIAASFVLVAAIAACVVAVIANRKTCDNYIAVNTSVRAIKVVCLQTTYRGTCEDALITNAANISSDLKSLIKASIQVAIDSLKEAAKHSTILEAAASDPVTYMPLQICMRLFDFGVQDLEDAVNYIQGYEVDDLHKAVSDLKNWISAARTGQETCLDEFQDKKSEAAVAMRKVLNRTIELTANAIEIVHHTGQKFSTTLDGDKEKNRRLLEVDDDGFPSWLSTERRRLLQDSPFYMVPTVMVSQDGTGNFTTIQEAVDKIPRKNKDFVVLFVREGVYREQVYVDKSLNKLVLVGEGPTKTRITHNYNYHGGQKFGIGTYQTATFAVDGNEFMAWGIGFENTAGPEGHQAVAFRSQSDLTVMVNCHFDGFQDTLYPQSKRQFYRDCTITGTVDFIFGNARALFQNCNIIARIPGPNQQNIVTAHGATENNGATLFVLHNCSIAGEQNLTSPTYLGRPWKAFAKTIFMQSFIDSQIDPRGYVRWPDAAHHSDTCLYAEIENRGPGANTTGRENWPGVHSDFKLMEQGETYTLDVVLDGAEWVKRSGAPFFVGTLPPMSLAYEWTVVPEVTSLRTSFIVDGPINPRIPPPSNKNLTIPAPKK